MTPQEIYKRMVATIREADVRLVAACMENHIGQENAVTIQQLTARTGLHERVVRSILSTLVTDYGIPIGAQSGKAGRYIISTEDERQAVIADLRSRTAETEKRIKALQRATLIQTPPVELREPEGVQETLFDLPEPKKTYQWGW